MSETEAATRPLEVVVLKPEEAASAVAREIAELLRARALASRRLVLGLASGRSPLGVYRELVRMHREEGLCFAHAVTFNLDEYLGLAAAHPRSFHSWMRRELFDHIDVPTDRIHIPRGDLAPEETADHARDFERAIAAAGGIDLQLLGLGRNGHIAFNEPGSERDSRMRAVELDGVTRDDCVSEFDALEHTPRRALTMGVATILEARRIRVLAFGEAKRETVRRLVHGPVGPSLPATFLREHPDVRLYVDRAAAGEG